CDVIICLWLVVFGRLSLVLEHLFRSLGTFVPSCWNVCSALLERLFRPLVWNVCSVLLRRLAALSLLTTHSLTTLLTATIFIMPLLTQVIMFRLINVLNALRTDFSLMPVSSTK